MDSAPPGPGVKSLPRRFRLGLSLAGGVSAGCYTAGVLDFIVEALDAWESRRDAGDASVPPHEVVVESIAGASAGAETAALLALVLRSRFPHVRLRPDAGEPADAQHNPIYAGWVHGATALDLLGAADWSDGAFKSLLDGSSTNVIADKARALPARLPPIAAPGRRWVADPLRLSFSVTNLDGVPLRVDGAKALAPMFRLHADTLRFALCGLGATPAPPPRHDETRLDAPVAADAWKLLTDAASASGAFPVLLPTRVVTWPRAAYQPVRVPLPPGAPGAAASAEFMPLWPAAALPATLRFVAADGGTLVNDPVDTVHADLLAASAAADDGEPRDGAVLLVHPLLESAVAEAPSDARERDAPPHRLIGLLARSVLQHARVSPAAVALAQRADVYSRFMIAPARPNQPEDRQSGALASSSLGAFGGYLHIAYRRHDYQLGRRNAQHALRRHLTLPQSHPLFDGWPAALRDQYRIQTALGAELPIIPLVGTLLDEEEPALDWPAQLQPTQGLAEPIDERLRIVVKGLLMAYLPRWPPLRWLLFAAWRWLFARAARRGLQAAMRKSLQAHGL